MRFVAPVVLVLGGLFTAPGAPAPKAGPPRLIVVSANADGNWDIYLVQPGTGETKKLTDDRAADVEPVWSPDGKRIVFVSDRDGSRELWVMKADGSNPTQLTKKAGPCANPRWSPDGGAIAFVSAKGGKENVYTADAATGKVAQLTDQMLPCKQPAWSPDGKKLAYTAFGGRWNGYVTNPDGTGNEKISGELGGVDMAWSPDGKRIAFTDVRQVAGWRLFVMDADGKNARLLNKRGNTYGNIYPQWSPDGKHISYGEMVDGVAQVGVVGADGTGARVITAKHMHLYTRWSPDGKSLCYCRFETGKPVVLMVSDPDGQNAKDLLRGVAPVPAEWRPK
jgi:TolB protein